jgi:hypothetical protein
VYKRNILTRTGDREMMTMDIEFDAELPTAIEIVTRTSVEVVTETDPETGEVTYWVDTRDGWGQLMTSEPFESLTDAEIYAELGIM